MLASLDAAIQAILDGGAVVSYAIDDRRVQRATMADLIALRRDLLAGRVPTGGLRTYVQPVGPGESEGWET
jgi:hypothetical protein